MLLCVVVHAADIQDADGLWGLLKRVKPLYPWRRAAPARGGPHSALPQPTPKT